MALDCSGDNRTTSLDALIALKMSVGKLHPDPCADADGDGIITAGDALIILKEATKGRDPLLVQIEEALSGFDPSLLDNTTRALIERFESERVEVVIKGRRELRFWVFMKGGKPVISENKVESTVIIEVSREIVEKAFEEQSADPLIKAFEQGELKVKGVGLINSIKFGLISKGLKLAQSFKYHERSMR